MIFARTGRHHLHAFIQFREWGNVKWLKIIFLTINVRANIRNVEAARDYTVKDATIIFQVGMLAIAAAIPRPIGKAGGQANKDR
jgi:hypothetical protein